jgi:hypothetical protein
MENPPNGVHVSLLTPFQDGGRSQATPAPIILDDGDTEYEVEAVLGHRHVGNKRLQYLIKFKGYGHEHNEWLFPSHLSCDELIQEYLTSPAYQRSQVKIHQKDQRSKQRQVVEEEAPGRRRSKRVMRKRNAK